MAKPQNCFKVYFTSFDCYKRPCGQESTEVWITQKIGKERGNSYWKNKEISGRNAHTSKWKLNWNFLTIIDVFLNQKRVNVCEHTVKMVPSLPCFYIHLMIRNVLTRRREYGTYLATARRHRRRIKMQKRDE